MLIQANQQTTLYPSLDWKSAIQWGDVVLFRFPTTNVGEHRSAEPRPCLVHGVKDIVGTRFVTLICGTEIQNDKESPRKTGKLAFDIYEPMGMMASGLKHRTRFNSRQRITASINHRWFGMGPLGTPIIGHLTPKDKENFNRIRARIQANIDLAASLKQQAKK